MIGCAVDSPAPELSQALSIKSCTIYLSCNAKPAHRLGGRRINRDERMPPMLKTPDEELFSPTTLGAIEVANRIAMAPLTRSRAHEDGVHSSLAIDYYRQRAAAGLIITEATNISRQGRGYALTPGIYTDAHVRAWLPGTPAGA